MIQEWQEFTAARKAFEALVTEKRDLNARERELRKELEAAASQGGIYDSALDLQVSGIGTRLAFIEQRRASLAALIATALDELRLSFRYADEAWTAIVKSGYAEAKADFYKLNTLVYGGEPTPPAEQTRFPSMLFEGYPATIREDTAIAMTSSFIRVVETSLPGYRKREAAPIQPTPKKRLFRH